MFDQKKKKIIEGFKWIKMGLRQKKVEITLAI